MSERFHDVAVTVNGEKVRERVDARKTLVDFLREDLALVQSVDITVVSLYFDISGAASPTGGHELPGRGQRELDFDGDWERFFAELDASKTAVRPVSAEGK